MMTLKILISESSTNLPILIGMLPVRPTYEYEEEIKIITANRMFQKLPTVLAQVQGGTIIENLLNEMRPIIYSFYRANIYQNRCTKF